MEAKCFDGDVAVVSTFGFHEHRERAPHLEQWVHQGRLHLAFDMAVEAIEGSYIPDGFSAVVDLGCGDGGFLSLFNEKRHIIAVGYDFQPTNAAGWIERGVHAVAWNFIDRWEHIGWADVYVITEVLEHLTDPHEMVQRIYDRGAQIVASSPHDETYDSHDACHAWAWDMEGYAKMLTDVGFKIQRHETVDRFQVVWGKP